MQVLIIMADQPAYIAVAKELGITVEQQDLNSSKIALIEMVNQLIITDFEKLVSILYRIDVSEKKINELLKTYVNENAAEIIVSLMLEREAEKIRTRAQFGHREDDIDENEKW